MFKKFSISLALLAFCFMSQVAFAGTMSFPKFTINVPEGWTSSQDGETVALIADDKTASLTITVAKSDGVSLKDLADAFSKQLKGSAPVSANNGYSFTFKSGPVESKAFITGDNKEYVLFAITGEHADISAIMDSVKEK